MIKVFCAGNGARAVCDQWLTCGTVGAACEFSFDSTWDGLRKTAVFIAGDTQRDVVLTEDRCVIPWEVLTQEKVDLLVGVYGVNGNGDIVIPTEYVKVGKIILGADPSGDESTDPTLPVWAQICSEIGELSGLETAEKNNLVAAINEAAQNGGGGGGTTDHNRLTNRNAADQHPISAITGLQSQLDGKQPAGNYALHSEVQSVRSEMDEKQNTLIAGSASVGQIAKITAVDGSGKPTAWEAVDMPQGGGGEEWELINVVEPTEEASVLHINKDRNGNAFNVKKALLLFYMPAYTGTSNIPSFAFVSINNITVGPNAPLTYTGIVTPSKSQEVAGVLEVECADGAKPYREVLLSAGNYAGRRRIGGKGTWPVVFYCDDGTEPAPNGITEIGTTGNLIYDGCHFALYGVRK